MGRYDDKLCSILDLNPEGKSECHRKIAWQGLSRGVEWFIVEHKESNIFECVDTKKSFECTRGVWKENVWDGFLIKLGAIKVK